MPRRQQSLQLTDRYRSRLEGIRGTVDRTAERAWARISTDDLDGTYGLWLGTVVPTVTLAQALSVRATAGYLGAYLTSELGKRVHPPSLDPNQYAGKSRDGRTLQEAFTGPLIGTKGAIKDGVDPAEALQGAFSRAMMAVGLDTDQSARFALQNAIDADDRFDGQERATSGTCGACAALSGTPNMSIHPGCKCVGQPKVAGVDSSLYPLPTGAEIFASKSPEEQDAMLGEQKAALLRSGAITLEQLVGHSEMETEPDWITERPLTDLVAT